MHNPGIALWCRKQETQIQCRRGFWRFVGKFWAMGAAVYVIRTDSGEVKVGFSGTPYARLSSIKREYGARRGFRDAQMVGFVSAPHFLVVESMAIHRLLPHATG